MNINQSNNRELFLSISKRWLFLILSTFIMVFFSEKMYWYIQGYTILELIIFYLFGVYLLLWVIQYFCIQNFWPLFLAAVTYPLYVEGLFTGIITFDITFFTMISYFIGWHTTISVIIGWYFHRKWLVNRETRKLFGSSLVLGTLWGFWSVIYWTSAQINDPELSDGFKPGQWSILDFSMLVLTVTVFYVVSHYSIGKYNIWQVVFSPSKLESITVLIVLSFFFLLQLVIAGILAFVLAFHFSVIFLVLKKYKAKRTSDKTILSDLVGEPKLVDTLIFLVMPIVAIIIYSFFYYNRPSDEFIETYIYWGIVLTQGVYGFIFYIISIAKTLSFNINES